MYASLLKVKGKCRRKHSSGAKQAAEKGAEPDFRGKKVQQGLKPSFIFSYLRPD
jgi:hypothetical protein